MGTPLEGGKTMNIEGAEKKAKEIGLEIKGKIVFDPYQGWIDEAPGEYGKYGFCILCELNVAEGFCELCSADEDAPCVIFS